MRHWLSLPLAALATLSLAGCVGPYYRGFTVAQPTGGPDCMRLAQPGDTKIQIYCNRPSRKQQASGDTTCRSLAKTPDDAIQTYCGNAADWDHYDTWAVNARVTCQWKVLARNGSTASQETCLNAEQWRAQWVAYAATLRRGPVNSGASSYPPAGVSSGSAPAYATSFGAFPAGGAIGMTW
jgi:hypothetical protein